MRTIRFGCTTDHRQSDQPDIDLRITAWGTFLRQVAGIDQLESRRVDPGTSRAAIRAGEADPGEGAAKLELSFSDERLDVEVPEGLGRVCLHEVGGFASNLNCSVDVALRCGAPSPLCSTIQLAVSGVFATDDFARRRNGIIQWNREALAREEGVEHVSQPAQFATMNRMRIFTH